MFKMEFAIPFTNSNSNFKQKEKKKCSDRKYVKNNLNFL